MDSISREPRARGGFLPLSAFIYDSRLTISRDPVTIFAGCDSLLTEEMAPITGATNGTVLLVE